MGGIQIAKIIIMIITIVVVNRRFGPIKKCSAGSLCLSTGVNWWTVAKRFLALKMASDGGQPGHLSTTTVDHGPTAQLVIIILTI